MIDTSIEECEYGKALDWLKDSRYNLYGDEVGDYDCACLDLFGVIGYQNRRTVGLVFIDKVVLIFERPLNGNDLRELQQYCGQYLHGRNDKKYFEKIRDSIK